MTDAMRVVLPRDIRELREMPVGTAVLLSGTLYTARDATHQRLVDELKRDGHLPYGLEGQVLFYAGPTPASAGRPAGAIGPTTAKRMDAWTPRLLKAGIAATIGKGARTEAVRQACIDTGAVYLAAVGGAAALLAKKMRSAELIAYPELGTEALMRVEFENLPVWVAIDAAGRDLYAEARLECAQQGVAR